ncbi:tumor necrosis factor receptor superfamily member 14 isoform X1 [Pogona vitticeps]
MTSGSQSRRQILRKRTMDRVFLLFLATQLLLFRETFSCEEWEYEHNHQCCPKCGAGYRVRQHCTAISSATCVPCMNRTYMDHPNGQTTCFRCHVCDGGAHLRVKEECTYQKNTVCACQAGYFCLHFAEKSCDMCQKHTVALPGYMVIELGTETSDTKFVACPPKTFSATHMSSSCEHWTNCSETGMIEVQPGSPTSDAICDQPNSPVHIAPIVISLALVIVVINILIFIILRKKMTHAKEGPAEEKKEEPNHYLPVPESDQHMVIPMQETNQHSGEPTYTMS